MQKASVVRHTFYRQQYYICRTTTEGIAFPSVTSLLSGKIKTAMEIFYG